MPQKFIAPSRDENKFSCPNPDCAAITQQYGIEIMVRDGPGASPFRALYMRQCVVCRGYSLWWEDRMIYPETTAFVAANEDLPEDVKADYEEAAAISSRSPRAAAALLRLAIQKLCANLGYNSRDLNDAIGSMVRDGLPDRVAKALDIVRVIGNNAIHPGEISVSDNPDMVTMLAELVNMIAEDRISRTSRIDEAFDRLPASARAAIERRDA